MVVVERKGKADEEGGCYLNGSGGVHPGQDARRESAERHDEHLPHRTRQEGGKRAHCHRRAGDVRSFERPTTRRMQGQSGKRVPVGVHSCRRALVHLRRWAFVWPRTHRIHTCQDECQRAARHYSSKARLEGHLFRALRCSCPTRVATRPFPLPLSSFGRAARVHACVRCCVGFRGKTRSLGAWNEAWLEKFPPSIRFPSHSSSCFWPAFLLTLARIDQ